MIYVVTIMIIRCDVVRSEAFAVLAKIFSRVEYLNFWEVIQNVFDGVIIWLYSLGELSLVNPAISNYVFSGYSKRAVIKAFLDIEIKIRDVSKQYYLLA